MNEFDRISGLLQSAESELQRLESSRDTESLSIQLSISSLQAHIDELRREKFRLNKERHKEVIEIRLDGEKSRFGVMPLVDAADILKAYGELINRTAEQILFAGKSSKENSKLAAESVDLKLESISSGSTVFCISAMTNPNLFGDSLSQNAISVFFELVQQTDPGSMESQISILGKKVHTSLKSFFHLLLKRDYKTEISWYDTNYRDHHWSGDKEIYASFFSTLNQIKEIDIGVKTVVGEIVTVSAKGILEVLVEDNTLIKVVYPVSEIEKIKELRIQDKCVFELKEKVVENQMSHVSKSSYTLVGIERK